MFRHSARSAFRPVPRQAGQGGSFGKQLSLHDLLLPTDVGAALAAPALHPEAALGATAALLDATVHASWESQAGQAQTPSSAERRRIQLAEKLLLVRAALQARIARQQAAAAGGSSGRFSPYPPTAYSPAPFSSQAARCAAVWWLALPGASQDTATEHGTACLPDLPVCSLASRRLPRPLPLSCSPVSIDSLPAVSLLEGFSCREAQALQCAHGLLAQYRA
jgi:hypothetical protein